MNRLITIILFSWLLASCDDMVRFEEPQPLNKRDLKSISKRIQGTYKSTTDSTYLTIDKNSIIEWTELDIHTLIDSLDIELDSSSMSTQADSTMDIIDSNISLKLQLKGDSVIGHYSYRDTIFSLSDSQLIRKFKEYYFINTKLSERNWQVRRLTLDNQILTFSKVQKPEDMEELRQITEVNEIKLDSGNVTGYKLNPTRKELKRLLNKSFIETGTYKRIN